MCKLCYKILNLFYFIRIEGKEEWKNQDQTNLYDYKLIQVRLEHILKLDKNDEISSMMFLLRAGLIRNLGGIGKLELYSNCHIGTKKLIERYIEAIVKQIRRISYYENEEINLKSKLDYFSDVLQSFGRTALIFHGGASFGN
jgi:TAG lipase/lysophosphatidylethanolamine acyltransferase